MSFYVITLILAGVFFGTIVHAILKMSGFLEPLALTGGIAVMFITIGFKLYWDYRN